MPARTAGIDTKEQISDYVTVNPCITDASGANAMTPMQLSHGQVWKTCLTNSYCSVSTPLREGEASKTELRNRVLLNVPVPCFTNVIDNCAVGKKPARRPRQARACCALAEWLSVSRPPSWGPPLPSAAKMRPMPKCTSAKLWRYYRSANVAFVDNGHAASRSSR